MDNTSRRKGNDEGRSSSIFGDELNFADEYKPFVVREAVPEVEPENKAETASTLRCGELFTSRELAEVLPGKICLCGLRVEGQKSDNYGSGIPAETISAQETYRQEDTASQNCSRK